MARATAGPADRRAAAAHEPSRPEPRRSRPAAADPTPLAPADELPRHVAIIMDGNRRWARQRDLPELEGHAAGVEAIRGLLRHAVRRGVPVLTLYAFSRENWARSDDEVTGLFGLLEAAIRERDRRSCARRASASGSSAGSTSCPTRPARRSGRPSTRRPAATRLLLNIAFNYAGRTEIVDAVRQLAASGVAADEIDEARDRRRAVHRRPARP